MKKLFALMLALALLLCGCGGQAGGNEGGSKTPVELDIAKLYTQLEAAGLPAMVDVDEQMCFDLYGIDPADVKEAKVAISDDGLLADEVWLLEAVDEAAAQKLAGLVKNRIQQKDDESIIYSPEQNAIVKKSYTAVEGCYVIFICSPEVEAMKAIVADAMGK